MPNRFVFGLIICVLLPINNPTIYAADVPSWRSLRMQHVIKQSKWWTCGAAAIATLLSVYYEYGIDESQILHDALQIMGQAERSPEGLSLLDLQQTLKAHGVISKGYRLTSESLYDYFNRGGLPVVMHLTRPKAHFVIAIGRLSGQTLAIADPSFGERVIDISSLKKSKGYQGYVLVPVPSFSQANKVGNNQVIALARLLHRQSQLTELEGDLHQLP